MTETPVPGHLIEAARRQAGLTQQELAARVGTSQPAIARLESGAINPTIETLTRCAEALGLSLRLSLAPVAHPDPVVERYKQDVDRTLLRENLRRTVDQRLRSLADLQAFGTEVRRAMVAKKRPKP
jgi:transcriptional regulator with XRE-family HTH domain